MMKNRFGGVRFIALLLSFLLMFPFGVMHAIAASSTTEIDHDSPGDKYIPGFRINLEAEIEDESGILVARCYFKTKKDKNFAFLDMFHSEDSEYGVTLPAPWVNSEAVEYVFVVVNKNKKVTRTQVFTLYEEETKEAVQWKEAGQVEEVQLDKAQEAIEEYDKLKEELQRKYRKKRPDYQSGKGQNQLIVNTELAKTRVPLNGFYDNAIITEVPKTMKYGFLADGLYPAGEIAAAGGSSAVTAATGATSAGTIAATSGLSTGAIVGIGVATVAVIGGGAAAAVAASGDDDDDDDDGSGPRCNQTTVPGGDAPETHTIAMGQSAGTFRFDYETYGLRDRMIVSYEGNTLFDSGCVGTRGTRTEWLTYSGGSPYVVVTVQPNCAGGSGTAWEFTVFCP